MKDQKWRFRGVRGLRRGLGVLCFSFLAFLFIRLTTGPDLDLTFSRQVPSPFEAAHLDRQISSVTRWPGWFISLARVDTEPSDSKMISQGSILKLHIDPKKGQKKRFDLTFKVTEYVPTQKLHLMLLDDSSGRLVRLFDRVEWILELQPNPKTKGSLIRGTAIAHTRHWRSRFFGRVSERILMNQIFYPNLVKLAELTHPFSLDPPAPEQGLTGPST